jgi:hypothetical protein
MSFQPRLEVLEERTLPSAPELSPLQQTTVAPLQAQFLPLIPVVQSIFQANLNNAEALVSTLPTQFQLLLSGVFAQDQQFVNALPALTAVWFEQMLLNYEANLLALSNSFAFSGAGFIPVFFPYGFGGLGYGGFGGLGYGGFGGLGYGGFGGLGYGGFGGLGYGYGGGAFTSGFSGGGSSGGGFSGSPAALVAGRGMGGGIMSTVGALTLPPSNKS